MYYEPHPDLTSQEAEPINGMFITPNGHDDYCLHCSQPLTLAPRHGDWGGYWFHFNSKEKNCLGKDLYREGIPEGD